MLRTICCALIFIALAGAHVAALSQSAAGPAHSKGSSNEPVATIQSIQSLIRSQHYDEAKTAITSALQRTPNDPRLFTLQGILYSIQKQRDNAIASFDRALTLAPNEPAALRGKAQLLYSTQDGRALPLLLHIVQIDPDDQTAHEMLAVLQQGQGDCAAAIDNFRLSGDLIHTHPASLESYASCLFDTSQFNESIPVLQQLASLLPGRTYPRYDLAVVLVRARQYDAALKLLDPLLETDASDPEVVSLASDAYERTGDTTKAVSLARQAIVLDPANPAYYTAFAQLCLTHESYDIGIKMLDAGIARIPNDASLYLARGLLSAQISQIDQAEADFKRAEALDSGQSLSAYATDLAELESNHEDVALDNIRTQLKAHPDSPLLHYILAKILDMRGESGDAQLTTEALASARDAVRLKPEMVEAHDLLAGIYARTGQNEKAIEECRLSLKYQNDDQTAMYHLLIALRHDPAGNHQDEVESLVARISELKKSSRNEETQRKKFKIVEQSPAPASSTPQ
jgi:tetratricopeptide (TPR) repeat protein